MVSKKALSSESVSLNIYREFPGRLLYLSSFIGKGYTCKLSPFIVADSSSLLVSVL